MATEGQRGRGQGPQQGQGKWEGGREEGRKWQQEGGQSWVTGRKGTGGEEARPDPWSEGGQVWEGRREVTGEQGGEGGQESLGLAGKGRDRGGDLSNIP